MLQATIDLFPDDISNYETISNALFESKVFIMTFFRSNILSINYKNLIKFSLI